MCVCKRDAERLLVAAAKLHTLTPREGAWGDRERSGTMHFVSSSIKKAEALLEQVDATAGELSVSVLAPAGDDVEARLSMTLAALDAERAERERREEEFTTRIKSLEAQVKGAAALERQVHQLTRELTEAREQRETAELQAMVDEARAEAQSARTALADALRESSSRLNELEQSNTQLAQELRRLSQFQSPDASGTTALDRAIEAARQERDEKVLAAETRQAAALAALKVERERGDRLDLEAGRALAEAAELRAMLDRQRQAADETAAALRRELVEQARAAALVRSDETAVSATVQERLQSLSNHVEAKQRQVDLLRSEKSALEQRLQEALLTQSMRARPGGEAAVGAKRSVRLRPMTSNRELEKMLEAADTFTLSIGNVLRTLPMARVGLLVYACFIHTLLIYVLLMAGGSAGSNSKSLRGAPE